MPRLLDEMSGERMRSPLGNGACMGRGSVGLAFAALSVYVLGGVSTFAGIGLLLFMPEDDLWGWGDGRSLGYLFVCVGLVLSIAGVLVMRILRNRNLS
jgi:hypothetical protein